MDGRKDPLVSGNFDLRMADAIGFQDARSKRCVGMDLRNASTQAECDFGTAVTSRDDHAIVLIPPQDVVGLACSMSRHDPWSPASTSCERWPPVGQCLILLRVRQNSVAVFRVSACSMAR